MLPFPLGYARTSIIYEHISWIGREENQIFQKTQCLIFILKISSKPLTNIFSLARRVLKYPAETKLLAILDYDSVVYKKQLLNISVNTLIFQMKTGWNMIKARQ